MRFSLKARLSSVSFALQGLKKLLSSQHNAWLHFVATIVVIAAAFVVEVTKTDFMFLMSAIVVVWLTEALNTAIEFLADAVSLEYNEHIKHAKDVAAGAVLIAATYALVIAVIVFLPYI